MITYEEWEGFIQINEEEIKEIYKRFEEPPRIIIIVLNANQTVFISNILLLILISY